MARNWPSTLPNPQYGIQIDPVDQTVRTEMEVGNARVRRLSMQQVDIVNVSWDFTDAQMNAFRIWFMDLYSGAAGGAAWFEAPLPIGTLGVDTATVRFVGPWKAQMADGMVWRVTASLEVRHA
jgi:hypothetical protein